MGEAKRRCEAGAKPKGDGYKRDQRQHRRYRSRMVKPANVTEKWMLRKGFKKKDAE
jgi:hypothetical protein